MAQCGHLQRELGRVAKSYLRKGSKVYIEGQIQTRSGPTSRATIATPRKSFFRNSDGELQLLDSREGGGGGSRGAFNDDFGGDEFSGGSAPQRSQSKPQPAPSTPTWTTTFRSDRC